MGSAGGGGGEERSERTNSSRKGEREERGQAAVQDMSQRANGTDVSDGDTRAGAGGMEGAGSEGGRECGAIAEAGDRAGDRAGCTIERAGNLGNKLGEEGRAKATEHISQRKHDREAREREGGREDFAKRSRGRHGRGGKRERGTSSGSCT